MTGAKLATFEILEIKPEHDRDICEIIKKVGEEYGAVGDGFGPSDAEVAEMSKHYCDQRASGVFQDSCHYFYLKLPVLPRSLFPGSVPVS